MNPKENVTPAVLPAGLSLKVHWVERSSLVPYLDNARRHGPGQVARIADSIRRFGFINPILIDAEGRVLAGHGRLLAAKSLGLDQVPAIRVDHLSEAELKAYRLADNRLAELAEWDEATLAVEFQELIALDPDFDLALTGFEMPRIDALIQGGAKTAKPDRADRLPETAGPVVSCPGDLWQLGPHRLLCGDVRDPKALERLMGEGRADLVFTDPPYNVRIDRNVCGTGSVRHEEFAMASGEMTREEFTGFLKDSLGNLARVSRDGAIHFVCMDWRHVGELLAAGKQVYGELKNLCVWVKDNGGMGSLYRSRHELVLVFKVGEEPHLNNVQLGRHGRYRTNVWEYPGVNTFRAGRMDDLAAHPTVKPVALVADAILDCSKRGGVVLDGFAGSGTTLLAAERTGRVARGLEIEPRYVDVAIRRWQAMARKQAIHAETGEKFDDRAAGRLAA